MEIHLIYYKNDKELVWTGLK